MTIGGLVEKISDAYYLIARSRIAPFGTCHRCGYSRTKAMKVTERN